MLFNNQQPTVNQSQDKTKNNLIVYCDGGARGNPGPAGIGFIVKYKNKILVKDNKYIGKTTNNVAEYMAVIKALKWLGLNLKKTVAKINVYLDSQLVVKQLNGLYKVKNSRLQMLIIQIRTLETQIPCVINYFYIPREKNRAADKLVNIALNKAYLKKSQVKA